MIQHFYYMIYIWRNENTGSQEPLIYSELARSTSDNLDLLLASEIGWKGQSCRTETLTYKIWHHLQVESVRTELIA